MNHTRMTSRAICIVTFIVLVMISGCNDPEIIDNIQSPARMEVNPTTLDFGTNMDSLSFTIKNLGELTLDWNIELSASSVVSLPIAGQTLGSTTDTVEIVINRSGLENDLYKESLVVHSQNATDTLQVQFEVYLDSLSRFFRVVNVGETDIPIHISSSSSGGYQILGKNGSHNASELWLLGLNSDLEVISNILLVDRIGLTIKDVKVEMDGAINVLYCDESTPFWLKIDTEGNVVFDNTIPGSKIAPTTNQQYAILSLVNADSVRLDQYDSDANLLSSNVCPIRTLPYSGDGSLSNGLLDLIAIGDDNFVSVISSRVRWSEVPYTRNSTVITSFNSDGEQNWVAGMPYPWQGTKNTSIWHTQSNDIVLLGQEVWDDPQSGPGDVVFGMLSLEGIVNNSIQFRAEGVPGVWTYTKKSALPIDTGYLLLGEGSTFNEGNRRINLMRLTTMGSLEQGNMIYLDNYHLVPNGLIETSNNKYIICGYIYPDQGDWNSNPQGADLFYCVIDENGALVAF